MRTCPQCGEQVGERAKFCPECGTALAEPRAAREERKVVTVVFCDLVGSTAQAERLDPEDVRAILSGYHERVRVELERFGGTVEKFIGDAVMALFGAPTAHEDDPERAVRAALAVRDALAGELAVRIGITTGETLITLGARPSAGEAMAAGDVVNTAARLQSAAPVDGILVDVTTYRATERMIEFRAAPAVAAKGKDEPVEAWEALHARSRFGVDVRQSTTAALVGRERERTLLAETLERVKDERSAQLVTLVGVPGIGKSRLVWELFRHIQQGTDLVTWRQGRSLPYGDGVAFWALGEIAKAQAGILETDSPDEAAAKLERSVRALVAHDRDAGWVERHLRPLVGLAGDEKAGERGESFAAWRRFLEALAEQRPLVLVFEDLHFADDGLLDFVDHLVDWATGVPLLVVGTARPELLERRPAWGGGKPNAATISLSPLSNDETASLLQALLDTPVVDAELQQTLLERAGGNPLYAEEFARLVAAGRKPRELPESVQGIVAARLDLLSADEKRAVHDASVVGKVFWLGTVAAMAGSERWALEQSLHGLERKEFVRRERSASVADETEYAFRHVLVRDVAYGQIPRAERAEKHLRAAEWIESLGRAEDHAEMLAHHYVAALELAGAAGSEIGAFAERARTALRDAGDRALGLHAHASAAGFYERALELWPDDDPGVPELLFGLGQALHLDADERAEALLERARDGFDAAGEAARAAEVSATLAELTWYRGRRARTQEHLEHARRGVEAESPSPAKARVLATVSRYAALMGEKERAIAVGGEAVEMARALGLDELVAEALVNVGTARVGAGDLGGLDDLEHAIELATAIDSPSASRAYNNLSAYLQVLGQEKRARELRREAVRVGERFGQATFVRFSKAVFIWESYSDGDWDAFVARAEAFVEESTRVGGLYQEGYFVSTLSFVALARGDEALARERSDRALRLGREVGDPQILFSVLQDAAFIAAELGELERARTLASELIARNDELGAYPFLSLVAGRLGIERELRKVVADVPELNVAAKAVRAVLDGDLAAAAELYAEMGKRPLEAYVRLRAAEQLLAQGRRREADEELHRSLAFWRSVGATRYVRQGETLLAATA